MAGEASTWLTFIGRDQVRVENPAEFTPPEGDAVAVLGASRPNWTGRFKVGDRLDLAQTNTIEAGKILRFTGGFRGPSRMPAVSSDEPALGFALADGQTLILSVDGGPNQVITLSAGQFGNIGAARTPELVAAINLVLTGATAYNTGEALAIRSDETGRGSRVQVVGGTAANLNMEELAWEFQLLVDGNILARRLLPPGEEQPLGDMAAGIAPYGPSVAVVFRLELVTL